jgi:hypothetical protein
MASTASTVREIKRIFESPEYQSDLCELSSYAESIMQERPMVYLLSKYLWRQDPKIELEKRFKLEERDKYGRQHDLVVGETSVEFKFAYDFDINYLVRELAKYKPDSLLWEAAKEGIHPTRSVTPGVYKDVIENKADIFVWIICARDLSGVNKDDLKDAPGRINQSKEQLAYNRKYRYGSTEFLKPVDLLLNKLQDKLQGRGSFSIDEVKIITDGHFPSTYHIKLCEFECSH